MTYSQAYAATLKSFSNTNLEDDGFITVDVEPENFKYAKIIIRELRDNLLISHGVENLEKGIIQLAPTYTILRKNCL
jgi:hypothetical protein